MQGEVYLEWKGARGEGGGKERENFLGVVRKGMK